MRVDANPSLAVTLARFAHDLYRRDNRCFTFVDRLVHTPGLVEPCLLDLRGCRAIARLPHQQARPFLALSLAQ